MMSRRGRIKSPVDGQEGRARIGVDDDGLCILPRELGSTAGYVRVYT